MTIHRLNEKQIAVARRRLAEVEELAQQVYGPDGWAEAQHVHAEALRNDPAARESLRDALREMLSPAFTDDAALDAAVERILLTDAEPEGEF